REPRDGGDGRVAEHATVGEPLLLGQEARRVELAPAQRSIRLVRVGPQHVPDFLRGRAAPIEDRLIALGGLGRKRWRLHHLRRVLRRGRGRQPPEQPCYKGEQGCSFRTADRRPPHPGPPGTRRAIPPCPLPRGRPWRRPWPARNRRTLRRLPETTRGSLPAR